MDFETKIKAVIGKVASSIGIDIGDRLTTGARKLKFVINGPLPTETVFPDGFRDFEVSTTFGIFYEYNILPKNLDRVSAQNFKVVTLSCDLF